MLFVVCYHLQFSRLCHFISQVVWVHVLSPVTTWFKRLSIFSWNIWSNWCMSCRVFETTGGIPTDNKLTLHWESSNCVGWCICSSFEEQHIPSAHQLNAHALRSVHWNQVAVSITCRFIFCSKELYYAAHFGIRRTSKWFLGAVLLVCCYTTDEIFVLLTLHTNKSFSTFVNLFSQYFPLKNKIEKPIFEMTPITKLLTNQCFLAEVTCTFLVQ